MHIKTHPRKRNRHNAESKSECDEHFDANDNTEHHAGSRAKLKCGLDFAVRVCGAAFAVRFYESNCGKERFKRKRKYKEKKSRRGFL